MAQVKVVVKATGPTIFQVHINEHRLQFDGQNEASVELSDAVNHIIRWFAMGNKGDTYQIDITAPAFIGWSHGATLDKDRKDAGKDWFSVRE